MVCVNIPCQENSQTLNSVGQCTGMSFSVTDTLDQKKFYYNKEDFLFQWKYGARPAAKSKTYPQNFLVESGELVTIYRTQER